MGVIFITETRKRGRPKKELEETLEVNENSMLDQSFYELASYYDVLSTSSVNHGITDITIDQLKTWLRNPPKFRKQLIQISKYFYVREGVVTDIYDIFNTLPTLNYSVLWNNMEQKSFKQKKSIVDEFIENIDVEQLSRDSIFTVIQEGTCVWYNRDNKYIQFLESEEYMIDFRRNGEWVVFYDLNYILQYDTSHNMDMIQAKIEAAPDEITLQSFINFKKDSSKYRYVELDTSKTRVLSLRTSRNSPYGIPYATPALASIMHKDLLTKVEKSLANRVLGQIVVQKIGTMPSVDGKIGLPVPKDTVNQYHNNLKNLIQKKATLPSEAESVAPLTIPDFIDIENLEVKTDVFSKDIWDRIDRDIYAKLGYSQSLNSGGGNGQSFGSSTINVEKIYSLIFYIVGQIEKAINDYMKNLVSSNKFNPKIRFSRTTILDKDKSFNQAKDLFTLGRGNWKDFVEAAGLSFEHWLAQSQYERDILKLDELLTVHETSFTSNGEGGNGRPNDSGAGKGNDSTSKSKGNGGNGNPKPSAS